MGRPIIGLAEFRDAGYLQEVNRRFFHPLGLALAVDLDREFDDGFWVAVWDSRDDPEGFTFVPPFSETELERAANIDAEQAKRAKTRKRLMGAVVQPLDWAGGES